MTNSSNCENGVTHPEKSPWGKIKQYNMGQEREQEHSDDMYWIWTTATDPNIQWNQLFQIIIYWHLFI